MNEKSDIYKETLEAIKKVYHHRLLVVGSDINLGFEGGHSERRKRQRRGDGGSGGGVEGDEEERVA